MIKFIFIFLIFIPIHLFSQSDSTRIVLLFENLSSQIIYWKYADSYSYYVPNSQNSFFPIHVFIENDSINSNDEYFISESKLKSSFENHSSIFFYYYSFNYDLNNVKSIKCSDNSELSFSMNGRKWKDEETLKSDLAKIKEFELLLEESYKLQKRNNKISEELTGKIFMAPLLTVVGFAGIYSPETGYKKTFAQIGGGASFVLSAYLVYDIISNLFESSSNKSDINKINVKLDSCISK